MPRRAALTEIERVGLGSPIGEQVHSAATHRRELTALLLDERGIAPQSSRMADGHTREWQVLDRRTAQQLHGLG
jgi:hypothetical protein